MKVIVDAGSTKITWAFCRPGREPHLFTGAGCNALTADREAIAALADEALADVRRSGISEPAESVEYYGAGCATESVCAKVVEALGNVFGVTATVGSDLLAAAKALFPDGDGIACILGTGANSCLLRNGKIAANVPPLGYILGDEGSGASLGKRLAADALRGILAADLAGELVRDFGVTKETVLERVYRRAGGNAFLAGLVPFIHRHRAHPDVRRILTDEFIAFFMRNVALYDDARMLPVGFVGSVAHFFADELRETGDAFGYKVTRIIRNPLDELIK